MDGETYLIMAFRWMHLLAAIAAVGGTFFARLALLPALDELPEEQRNTLHTAIRSRWSKVVMISIGLLLVSGIYNVIKVFAIVPEELKGMYHPLFGIKFLLALAIFFIASALVGRSAAFEKLRANARFWLGLNAMLAVVLVGVSVVLRVSRDSAAQSSKPNSPPTESRANSAEFPLSLASPAPPITVEGRRSGSARAVSAVTFVRTSRP